MNEEEKAIEYLKKHIMPYNNGKGNIEFLINDVILNLIDKQNKVIDEMAEVLNDFDYDKQCESCHTDICSASVDGTEYTKCIKQYFIRKAEEDE